MNWKFFMFHHIFPVLEYIAFILWKNIFLVLSFLWIVEVLSKNFSIFAISLSFFYVLHPIQTGNDNLYSIFSSSSNVHIRNIYLGCRRLQKGWRMTRAQRWQSSVWSWEWIMKIREWFIMFMETIFLSYSSVPSPSLSFHFQTALGITAFSRYVSSL